MMDPRLHLKVIASRDRVPPHPELAVAGRSPGRRRFRPLPGAGGDLGGIALTVRIATAQDQVALWRLATLDSARPPSSPVLVAELEDRLVAALSLADGCVIADPFTPTVELVEMLRLRARQLAEGRTRNRVATRFRARLFGRLAREPGLTA